MRPSFDVQNHGSLSFKDLPSGLQQDFTVVNYSAQESSSGVSRHKPTGWIPPSDYQVIASNRRGSLGTFKLVNPFGNGYEYHGAVVNLDGTGPVHLETVCNQAMSDSVASDVSSLETTALIRARANLKDQSVDLGTAFGERNQTARQIGDAATRMAKAARNLRAGRIRNAMRDLGILGKRNAPRGSNWTNNWLELQYGWKPLLSDIYGACDALSKRGPDDWMVTAKGSAHDKVFGYYSANAGDFPPDCYSVSAQAERGAFVRIDASPSGTGFIQSLSSVGVLNPLNVVWELVPYSFVVDWFIPVGAWIGSLDATVGFTIRGCSSSVRSDARWRLVSRDTKLSDGTEVTTSFSGTKRRFFLIRNVSVQVPIPSFPSLKDPVSLGHMANGLSLLAQAFRR